MNNALWYHWTELEEQEHLAWMIYYHPASPFLKRMAKRINKDVWAFVYTYWGVRDATKPVKASINARWS